VKRVALLVVASSCAAFSAQVDPLHEEHCPGATCLVKVVLKEKDGWCKVDAPTKTHKIKHAFQTDTVQWQFENNCSMPMRVGIDNFRGHPKETCTDRGAHDTIHVTEAKEDPLQTCSRRVDVPANGRKDVTCRLKATKLIPRTYKYDFVGSSGEPILDPEIEIVR